MIIVNSKGVNNRHVWFGSITSSGKGVNIATDGYVQSGNIAHIAHIAHVNIATDGYVQS